MASPVVVYVGLGSNQGDRDAALCDAVRALERHGVTPLRLSPFYDTDYIGPHAPQAPYLNAVLEARTDLEPLDLLSVLQRIEIEAGRIPGTHERPRPLDLDLLFYGDRVVSHPGLTVPHPRIAERRFVLQPLRDLGVLGLAPGLAERLAELESQQDVRPAGVAVPGE